MCLVSQIPNAESGAFTEALEEAGAMASSKKVCVLDFAKDLFGSPFWTKGKTFSKMFALVY